MYLHVHTTALLLGSSCTPIDNTHVMPYDFTVKPAAYFNDA
jgi:hypothetical protein